jgi:hypothetical protein
MGTYAVLNMLIRIMVAHYLFTFLMIPISMALLLIAGGAFLLVLPVHHRLVDHVALQNLEHQLINQKPNTTHI